jgi:cytochrome c-type biogenesis protein
MSTPDVGYLAAYGAGLISFLSPCVLPLIPAYMSVISGVDFADIESGAARGRVIRASIGFVLGFSLVFVALGATASAVGAAFAAYRDIWARGAGVLAIVMGLVLLGVIRTRWLSRERRFHLQASKLGPLAAPLLGAGFAFGWTPCIGPVLAAILAYASTQATVGQGAALLATYAAGLATPFLGSAVAFSRMAGTWAWFKRHGGAVNAVAGGLLVAMGLLLVTGQMRALSALFLRLVPQAARLG